MSGVSGAAVEASGLGKRYGKAWALRDCTLSRPAGRLSGGQQAQVALTLALAKRAPVLLLDEPVAGLDPIARRDVMTMLMTRVAEEILACHARLVGPGGAPAPAGAGAVIERADSSAQAVLLARIGGPVADPRWQARPVTIEDVALGYLAAPRQRELPGARLSAVPV